MKAKTSKQTPKPDTVKVGETNEEGAKSVVEDAAPTALDAARLIFWTRLKW